MSKVKVKVLMPFTEKGKKYEAGEVVKVPENFLPLYEGNGFIEKVAEETNEQQEA